ncbi:S8 family serine peptidase, partial [bacterium]|nr:S8 family serine peptidase [bacterium]
WYNASVSSPPGPVIAVGATNTSDNVASFSSIGPTVWDFNSSYTSGWHDYPSSSPLMKPDIAAPGDNIMTTSYGGGYEYTTGTSFACPFVAGIVALLLSKNSELTPREIDSVLENSATDISDPGRDNYSGAGLVNADSALAMVSGKALAMDSVRFDDLASGDGDRNLDPGETGNVLIYIRNAGSVSAPNVQVSITSVSNPHISVVDGNSNYGTIAAGATGVNTSDPIVFSISSAAKYGEYCMCYVNISDGSGYSHPDSFAFRVGIYPYQAIWHDTLATLRIDISNFAIFGYYYYGGLYWPWPSDSTNNIYAGYPMVGQGPDYVADGGMDLFPFDSIWQYDPGGTADKETYTALIDSTNDYYIRQYTYQWRSSPNNDFIIFYYKIFNRTASTMSGVRAGFYVDFDIPPYDTNYAQWDNTNQWVYMYHSSSGKYFGIVALENYDRGSVVDNPQYVYGDTFGMGWTDTVKWNFLTGTFSQSSGSSPKDWSVILSFGPFTIPSGDFVVFSAAVVAGNGLSDFTSNANQAKVIYASSSLSIDEGGKQIVPEDVALFGVYPNPFNSATKILFALTEPAEVSVDIFDLSGRLVREFAPQKCVEKSYTVVWNGKDNSGRNLPSGVYLVKLSTGKTVLTRKVFLSR